MAGGLLVAIAVLGVFALAGGGDRTPSTRYVVAASDIDPGQPVDGNSLAVRPIDLPNSVASSAFTEPSSLEGAVAIAPLRSGELVQRSAVLVGGAATRAHRQYEVSFRLDRSRAMNGTLNRGERVDVLATYGDGDSASTRTAVQDALVTGGREPGAGRSLER